MLKKELPRSERSDRRSLESKRSDDTLGFAQLIEMMEDMWLRSRHRPGEFGEAEREMRDGMVG